MSIKQIKPGLWALDVRAWKDGREYRKREEYQGGRKAAESRVYEIRKELQDRAASIPRSLTFTTFSHLIDYYVERNPPDKKSKSYFNRLKSDLGNVSISDLRDRFDQYLLLLRKSKGERSKRPLSNQTINHYLKWARAAINFCVRAGKLEKNPLEHFEQLPTHPRDRMLTEDEKNRLLEVVRAEAPHLYPIVLFSIQVPARKGELTTLKRSDYDMVNNCVIIPGDRTKNDRPCIKPVPENLVSYMRSVPVESEYLFYRKRGGKYLPLGDFRKAFNRCKKLAEIQNFKFHDSRRISYTTALLNGTAPHVVMQVSGHMRDMSKVYFGRNELLAAKMFRFGESGQVSGLESGFDRTSPVLGGISAPQKVIG